MCGLLFTNDPQVDPEVFRRALDTMRHRGPDAPGCYQYLNGVHLGHNRLSIFDLDSRSNQPFASRDGRYQLIFNGEIYNFHELARRYSLKLRTTSDTEVLVELFARFGERMLPELNGMFAFVILDTTTNAVFAARDRLGIKPLYHRTDGRTHTFSSEIAPLLELYPDTGFDSFGIRQYKKLRTFFNGRTLYSSISMFPAGAYFNEGRTRTYWTLPGGPAADPDDDELRHLIESAVKYRRVADVAVGSYLSGGLDSTIIAALAERPHTWTVGTAAQNEFAWGQLAATSLRTTHHEVLMAEEDFLPTAVELIKVRREPLSVPNEVLIYQMTRAVKEHNTVILSGEGADELFFGYDRIFRWASGAEVFDLRTFDSLYSYGSHEDLEVLEDALDPFTSYGSPVAVLGAFFQVGHLHGLLRRLDNSTMRCSVEARVPFVDHRIVERMAGVAYDFRMRGGIVKAPLKRIFADLVPVGILERQKVGFPVDLAAVLSSNQSPTGTPMDSWLRFNLEVLGIDEQA